MYSLDMLDRLITIQAKNGAPIVIDTQEYGLHAQYHGHRAMTLHCF
ncbi:MAG TPA: hypothetical protein VI756_01895 [Blastocatellia bacterium]